MGFSTERKEAEGQLQQTLDSLRKAIGFMGNQNIQWGVI